MTDKIEISKEDLEFLTDIIEENIIAKPVNWERVNKIKALIKPPCTFKEGEMLLFRNEGDEYGDYEVFYRIKNGKYLDKHESGYDKANRIAIFETHTGDVAPVIEGDYKWINVLNSDESINYICDVNEANWSNTVIGYQVIR